MLIKQLLCSKHKPMFPAALLLWRFNPQPTVCPDCFHSVSVHSCSPPGPHIPWGQQWPCLLLLWGPAIKPRHPVHLSRLIHHFFFHLFYHLYVDDNSTTIDFPRLLWRLEIFCSGGLSQLMGAMIDVILLIHPSHGPSVFGAQALEHWELKLEHSTLIPQSIVGYCISFYLFLRKALIKCLLFTRYCSGLASSNFSGLFCRWVIGSSPCHAQPSLSKRKWGVGTAIQSFHWGLGPEPRPRKTHSFPTLSSSSGAVAARCQLRPFVCWLPVLFSFRKIVSIPSYNYLKFIEE